jgi:hypothetical protein
VDTFKVAVLWFCCAKNNSKITTYKLPLYLTLAREMNIEIEAAARMFAVKYGAIELSELIAWADAIILKLEVPPTELFDVSLAKSVSQAVSALNELGIGACNNKPELSKTVFGIFYNHLNSENPNYERISKALFDMYMENLVPDAESGKYMISYWDELDLAELGSYGNVEEIKVSMKNLLKEKMR